MPRRRVKDARVGDLIPTTVYLSPETHRALKTESALTRKTMSELVEYALTAQVRLIVHTAPATAAQAPSAPDGAPKVP